MPKPMRSRKTVRKRRLAAGIGVEDARSGGVRQAGLVRCLLMLVGAGGFGGPDRSGAGFQIHRAPPAGAAGERDAARLLGAPRGVALDLGGTAGWADEGLPVPISDDQDQGFG